MYYLGVLCRNRTSRMFCFTHTFPKEGKFPRQRLQGTQKPLEGVAGGRKAGEPDVGGGQLHRSRALDFLLKDMGNHAGVLSPNDIIWSPRLKGG